MRLSPEEVRTLGAEGRVRDAIRFGAATLIYEIRGVGTASVEVEYAPGAIEVRVPEAQLRRWTETDRVGIEAVVPNPGEGLRVLLEKDWRCLTERPGEDEAHLYPHPGADE